MSAMTLKEKQYAFSQPKVDEALVAEVIDISLETSCGWTAAAHQVLKAHSPARERLLLWAAEYVATVATQAHRDSFRMDGEGAEDVPDVDTLLDPMYRKLAWLVTSPLMRKVDGRRFYDFTPSYLDKWFTKRERFTHSVNDKHKLERELHDRCLEMWGDYDPEDEPTLGVLDDSQLRELDALARKALVE